METTVKRIFFFMKLRQRTFNKSSGGTKQCGDPHPEYSSGATGGNRSYNAHQISHADTGCGGDDQCLKGRQTSVFLTFFC